MVELLLFSGKVADISSQPLLGGEESVETSDGENPVIMEPSSDSAPQYSPSVSHDEKEEEEEQWAGLEAAEKEEWEGLENTDNRKEESSPSKGVYKTNVKKSTPIMMSVHSNKIKERGSKAEGDSEDDWGAFDEGEGGSTLGPDAGGWGSVWTTESDFRTSSVASSQSQGDLQQDTPLATPTTPTGSKGKLKLSSKSKRTTPSSSEEHTAMATSPMAGGGKRETVVSSIRNSLSSSKSTTSELGEKMKGRLKKEDVERLEQQALLAAAEPDFFADMTPKIGSSSSSSGSLLASPRSEVKKTEPVVIAPSTSLLQYQPTSANQVS